MFFCVLQHLKKRNRVRMIEYFIDVAKECINIGNFNSLMAIIGKMCIRYEYILVTSISTFLILVDC